MDASRPPHPTPPRQRTAAPDLHVPEGGIDHQAWPEPDPGDAGPPEAASRQSDELEPDFVPAEDVPPDPEPAATAIPEDESEAEPPHFH
jgi:hypothetical protein